MKICFVSEVYHPTINGVVISMDTFARELKKKGHKVIIFAPDSHRHIHDPSNVFRVKSLKIPYSHDYFLSEPGRKAFVKIARLDPDIIHTQHMFKMGWFGVKAAKKLNIPVVHTYHTLITEYTKHIPFFGSFIPTKKIIQSFIIKQTLRYAEAVDTFITPSKAMASVLKQYGISRPIEVVSTGVDIGNFANADGGIVTKKYKIDQKTKLIVFVGRLSFEKNIMLLLRSFQKVLNELPSAKLMLVGSGPQESYYRSYAKKAKIEKQVVFAGFVAPSEVKHYLKAADVFAFPSVTDTQGIVIVEAMAAKTPVIAVNKLGPTDVVKNEMNGLLVEPTVRRFATALLRVLKNKLFAKRLVHNAYKEVKKYSSEAQAQKLERIYIETIKEKRANGKNFN